MTSLYHKTLSKLKLPKGLHSTRIQWLNEPYLLKESMISNDSEKSFVLYWMQTSMRTTYNYSLEYAITIANYLKQPLHIIYIILDKDSSQTSVELDASICWESSAFASERHMYFLLNGLHDVYDSLMKNGKTNSFHMIRATQTYKSIDIINELSKKSSIIITDRGYLQYFTETRDKIIKNIYNKCDMIQVEGDIVVPVEIASNKEEYAARTIRPKITKHLNTYITPLNENCLNNKEIISIDCKLSNIIQFDNTLSKNENVNKILSNLSVDKTIPKSITSLDSLNINCLSFNGGMYEANKVLETFIHTKLIYYSLHRNEPSGDGSSNLSPYLRYGHISPVEIALKINNHKVLNNQQLAEGKKSFLEEMIVRRELSVNFVSYNAFYYDFKCLPDYARETLILHKNDKRPHTYSYEQLLHGKTQDSYWNAAQLELIHTGKMQNYMRMYWGKKIIEWTSDPKKAFDYALDINNKYELDAVDPNSYTGVAWVFGKHDQGWKERNIFGKVRYMNDVGLKRKFKMDKYILKIKKLCNLVEKTNNSKNDKTNDKRDLNAFDTLMNSTVTKKKKI